MWPVAFIALGLWLLLRRTPTGRAWPDGSVDDVIDVEIGSVDRLAAAV